MGNFFQSIGDSFYTAVIADNRWQMYLEGLGNTLIIALSATSIGILIGLIIAVIKYYAVDNKKLWILDKICDLYLVVIRGTPVVVQLLILYTAVFTSLTDGLLVAVVGFGINSGAYVAEIIRSGIMSIDKGQSEAGRSLGLNNTQTMRMIILPQAFKNILPALFNEFIALLKETSVAGMIAVRDLTKAADGIKGRIFEPTPLFIAAIIYLILVIGMTAVQRAIERRLSASDRH